jgi:hypothetical protein
MIRAVVLLLLLHLPAAAQAPPRDYLAARDRAMTQAARGGAVDDAAALRALEAALRRTIGPVSLPGFPGPGAINLQTLAPEMGFGALDALRFEAPGRMALVTSEALLRAWAADRRFWLPGPQEPDALFGQGRFLAAAWQTGAAAEVFAALPGPGRSLLFAWRQDVTNTPPDALAVSLMRQGRVLLLVEEVRLPQAPGCAARRAAAEYRRCYTAWLAGQPDQAVLVERARVLAAQLPD